MPTNNAQVQCDSLGILQGLHRRWKALSDTSQPSAPRMCPSHSLSPARSCPRVRPRTWREMVCRERVGRSQTKLLKAGKAKMAGQQTANAAEMSCRRTEALFTFALATRANRSKRLSPARRTLGALQTACKALQEPTQSARRPYQKAEPLLVAWARPWMAVA